MDESANMRLVAIRILTAVVRDGKSLGELLPVARENLESREAALLQELTFGVCRWSFRLQLLLGELQKKPLRNKDTDVKVLLWLALYEIVFMRTPDYAVVNSYTGITRKLGKQWAKGLTNGTLREFLRRREIIENKAQVSDEGKYSSPEWIISSIQADWPQQVAAIFEACNRRAPLVIRVNARQSTRQDYLERLRHESLDARMAELGKSSIVLDNSPGVASLPGFAEGHLAVQDSGAQLAAELVDPQAGERILDACAAPGGKTCHMLEMQPELDVVALDADQSRLNRVTENLRRLQLSASCICADATDASSWWDGRLFDAILLDAPCSALGVLRRHPDIRLLRRKSDIQSLVSAQKNLLDELWQILKPGGRLIYATCSVLKKENEQQVGEFIKRTDNVTEQKIMAKWGYDCSYGRQILPGQHEADGFYYAILIKSQA